MYTASGVWELLSALADELQAAPAASPFTRPASAKVEPILIVGDDRGGINTLKLSPNLRKRVERDDNTDPGKTDEADRVALRLPGLALLLP